MAKENALKELKELEVTLVTMSGSGANAISGQAGRWGFVDSGLSGGW
jgi:hypothetical protein